MEFVKRFCILLLCQQFSHSHFFYSIFFFLCWVVKVELELKLIGIYVICNLNFLDSYIFLSLIYVFFFLFKYPKILLPYNLALPIEGKGQPGFLSIFCWGDSWEEEEREKYFSGREYKNSIEFLLAMRILIFYNKKKWNESVQTSIVYLFEIIFAIWLAYC